MTLTDMKYLIAVASECHFGKAAQRCHVSQPTLSVAIKKVESSLGAPLFERGASVVSLTPLGQKIVEQAKRVLAEVVQLEDIAAQGKNPLKGTLKVGVIYTIAPYLLPQLVPALHRRAPEMPLYLKEDFTEHLIPALKAGALDAIVLALPVSIPGLVELGLYQEPFRVVVPENHAFKDRVASSSLNGDEMLLLGQGNCFRDQVLEACPSVANRPEDVQAIEGGSLETLRYMVSSGAGIAIMPSSAADPLKETESLVRVLRFEDPQPFRTVGLVWRASYPRPAAIDALTKAILDCKLAGTHPAR